MPIRIRRRRSAASGRSIVHRRTYVVRIWTVVVQGLVKNKPQVIRMTFLQGGRAFFWKYRKSTLAISDDI